MRKYLVPLFAGNGFAFLAIGISYLLYSRLLTPREFGIYSAALAIGSLSNIVLDGGIKSSIIKHARALSSGEEGAVLTLMLAFSAVLLLALVVGHSLVGRFYPAVTSQTTFLAAFAGVYLLTYPWIGIPTAGLERQLAYSRLAWIESASIAVERGSPALFLYVSHAGLFAFVWGLIAGRLLRIVALSRFHPVPLNRHLRDSLGTVLSLVKEGAWYQAGAASAFVRDNLHVLIVGPLFGTSWIGYYGWGMQLCLMASQIFVQISARVTLPIAAQTPAFADRWASVSRQIALLTAVTGPILAACLLVAPAVDRQFFADKWRPALVLLPLLFARMIPGMACAPMGALLLVEAGARSYAIVLWLWTALEVLAALIAVELLGAIGLGVSYSLVAWCGVLLMVRGMRQETWALFRRVAGTIFERRGLWVSVVAVAAFLLTHRDWQAILGRMSLTPIMAGATALVILAYLVDVDIRRLLLLRPRALLRR